MSFRSIMRAIGLFCLLMAIYFLTYHGQSFSTDEQLLFDSARSFVRNGTTQLAYTNDLHSYSTLPDAQPVQDYGETQILPIIALSPLIWLAERLPGIGVMQSAWLFNIVVTALTAVVLFAYGKLLGYRERSALGVALLFGLCTLVWAYSQMFFREPLLMLLALSAAYCLERARRRGWRTIWPLLGLLASVGAIYTKDAGVTLLPVLLLVAIPASLFKQRRAIRWLIIILPILMVLAIVVGAFVFARNPAIANRLNDLGTYLTFTPVALPAYLFGPGFSIWAFAPILLLGLWGAYRLLHAREYRQVAVPLSIYLIFVAVHVTINGYFWYGGLAWGPRFLVPVTPFLALWLLPVFERAVQPARAPILKISLGLFAALSFALQILAAASPIRGFGDYLASEGQRLGREIVPWREGVWELQYIPQIVQLRRVGDAPSPLAIAQVPGSAAIVIPLCLLTIGLGALLIRGRFRRRWLAILGLLGLGLSSAVMFGGGLLLFARDLRYGGNDPTLFNVLATLRAQAAPGDVVLLGNRTYRLFFMNFYKLPQSIYVLPQSPGERQRLDQDPEIVSPDMEERAHSYFQEMLARLADGAARWWFLTEYNAFDTARFRVTENYLVRHYFPAQEVLSEPRARLLLFAPIPAPLDMVPPWPALSINADFGAATLIGADLPRGLIMKAGQMLPVSLLWTHNGWPDGLSPFDYGVNVSLIDKSGATRAQRAQQPMGGFAPLTSWVKGGFYRDNQALVLPADLPPGEYELWVLLFDWRTAGKNLPLRNRTDGAEHVVIARITVIP